MTFCKIIIKALWEKEKALLDGAILNQVNLFVPVTVYKVKNKLSHFFPFFTSQFIHPSYHLLNPSKV